LIADCVGSISVHVRSQDDAELPANVIAEEAADMAVNLIGYVQGKHPQPARAKIITCPA
jgi:hypothetical protein